MWKKKTAVQEGNFRETYKCWDGTHTSPVRAVVVVAVPTARIKVQVSAVRTAVRRCRPIIAVGTNIVECTITVATVARSGVGGFFLNMKREPLTVNLFIDPVAFHNQQATTVPLCLLCKGQATHWIYTSTVVDVFAYLFLSAIHVNLSVSFPGLCCLHNFVVKIIPVAHVLRQNCGILRYYAVVLCGQFPHVVHSPYDDYCLQYVTVCHG